MASEAAAAAAKAKKLNLEKATNFMRQYRDPHSRELKKLSANQFMEVWSHYDKDGECIQASSHCCLVYTTYVLTPRSRVVLEKLTGFQLVKKFHAFYGTRRFITAVTSAFHVSLSPASSMQSILPHPTSWRSILILSSHLPLSLPSGLFPSGLLPQSHVPSTCPYPETARSSLYSHIPLPEDPS